jgi:prenyl protein peptidase
VPFAMSSGAPPDFSQAHAFALLVAYCFVYVLPLYASAATRPSPTRSRDAPEAIRARIRAVSFSTAACSVATLLILFCLDVDRFSPWHLMGYWPVNLVSSAKAVFLTALLFAGPLFECLVVDGEWQQWLRLQPIQHVWSDWPAWRNLVAVRLTLFHLLPLSWSFLPC